METTNKQLAAIFKEMSSIYRYMGGEERFRSLAYLKASQAIEGLPEEVSVYFQNNALEQIPGVGAHIAEKIEEFLRTGKIDKYESLKKMVPFGIIPIMDIKGFGPKSLKTIYGTLKISTAKELLEALKDGRVAAIKGFGKKKVEKMLRGWNLHQEMEKRMLLWDAMLLGRQIVSALKQMKGVKKIALAGSLRRSKETIGDIDILVACDQKDRKAIVHFFTGMYMTKEVLAGGETKASIILKENHHQVDLRLVTANEWGAALLYFTGSKEHNIYLRTLAKEKGMKISEYGVYQVKGNKRVAGKTEEEIYAMFDFQWIPPELRENKGEFELAAKQQIPKLIELKDIKGDMQMHSQWSDGLQQLEEMARFVQSHYGYEYLVVTDHSKAQRVAHGMDEAHFIQQLKEIEMVNNCLGSPLIKSGAEVDILADGSLDLTDDLLEQLNWVCASIHSGFSKDNTARLIKACRHPLVNCIGHPSGRLIGRREAYAVNWREVFAAARETGTAMEINAQPDRMDLSDELAMAAREAGVTLAIASDAHMASNYDFMTLGVSIARRSWCTADDILNTKSWKAIEAFVQRKRK